MDEVSGRLNTSDRGIYLGAFDTGDSVIALYKDGTYEVNELDLNKKYDVDKITEVSRLTSKTIISVIYFEGEKEWSMAKRFSVETSKIDTKYPFISESSGSKLYFATTAPDPKIKYSHKSGGSKQEEVIELASFIDVKGWKATGNRIGDYKILKTEHLNPPKMEAPIKEKEESKPTNDLFSPNDDNKSDKSDSKSNDSNDNNDELKAGDTIDLDF
jgi:topoisomerase-4 subunit A